MTGGDGSKETVHCKQQTITKGQLPVLSGLDTRKNQRKIKAYLHRPISSRGLGMGEVGFYEQRARGIPYTSEGKHERGKLMKGFYAVRDRYLCTTKSLTSLSEGIDLLRQISRYRSPVEGYYLQVDLLFVIAHQRQTAQRNGLFLARGIPEGVTGFDTFVAHGYAPRQQQLPTVATNTGDRDSYLTETQCESKLDNVLVNDYFSF